MILKHDVALIGAGLLLGSCLCLAQDAPDRQQQIDEHNNRLKQYLQEKRPDLAIPELQALAVLDPNNADIRGNLGVLLFFKGDCASAAPELRAATNLQSGLWRIQVLLSICEKRQGDGAAAQADLESAFPHLEDQKLLLQAGMELIDIDSETGEMAKAADVVNVLRERDPTNPDVLYTAYRIYSDMAGESMLSLSLVNPDSAQMHRVIAHELTKQGNVNGAIANYRQAITLDPKLTGIHFELAELLRTSQDATVKKEAETEYQKAYAENPMDTQVLLRLGEIDEEMGNTHQAFEKYSKAVQIAPNNSDAKLSLAKTLIETGQQEKAQALLEETVKLEPTNAVAHYRLGTLYRKLGRADDAKREIALYKKYKDMKEKLRTIYKQLQIQREDIRADEKDAN
jgi:tetratricopeptide (TPR) repeat protein